VAVVVVTHDPGVAARVRRRVTHRDGRQVDDKEPAR
jgi:predicted ABC-type transport system involved in lysophospholipase L1 biosynthesis ATPase subunit